MVWSAALETGHPLIDADHRQLIERFNRLIDPAARRAVPEMTTLLAELFEETRRHFEREEALMGVCPAALAVLHRAEHQRLLDEFSHQVEDWLDGAQSCHGLTQFLSRWLMRHITTLDRSLVDHLQTSPGVPAV